MSFCFFIIKPTRCTNFSNLLQHEPLNVSGNSSAHHQDFIHCTLGTGILVCHTGLQTAFEWDQDWYLLFCIADCLVCRSICSCIPDSQLYRITVPILVPLESCLQTCMTYTSAECTVNKLRMMGRGIARNIWSFMSE